VFADVRIAVEEFRPVRAAFGENQEIRAKRRWHDGCH